MNTEAHPSPSDISEFCFGLCGFSRVSLSIPRGCSEVTSSPDPSLGPKRFLSRDSNELRLPGPQNLTHLNTCRPRHKPPAQRAPLRSPFPGTGNRSPPAPGSLRPETHQLPHRHLVQVAEAQVQLVPVQLVLQAESLPAAPRHGSVGGLPRGLRLGTGRRRGSVQSGSARPNPSRPVPAWYGPAPPPTSAATSARAPPDAAAVGPSAPAGGPERGRTARTGTGAAKHLQIVLRKDVI